MQISLISVLQISIFIFSSQIGSGFFLLPSLLSDYGYLSLFALFIVGLFGFFIINIFAQSEKNIRGIIKDAYGEKVSKFIFFIYWFISWFSTVVLFKEIVGYMGVPYEKAIYVEGAICLAVTLINMWKLKYTLYLENILTFIKLIPFVLLIFAYFCSPSGESVRQVKALNPGLFLKCIWCFLGLETGSIIGKNLKINYKEKQIGSYLGVISVLVVYLMSVFLSFKIKGNESLIGDPIPYLSLLIRGFGSFLSTSFVENLVRGLITFALLGSINSWTVSSGYTAEECARNGILPKSLQTRNLHGVPYLSVFWSSFLVFICLLICNSPNLYSVITKAIDVSCCFFIGIYGVCAFSYGKLIKNQISKVIYYSLGIILCCFFFYSLYDILISFF